VNVIEKPLRQYNKKLDKLKPYIRQLKNKTDYSEIQQKPVLRDTTRTSAQRYNKNQAEITIVKTGDETDADTKKSQQEKGDTRAKNSPVATGISGSVVASCSWRSKPKHPALGSIELRRAEILGRGLLCAATEI
jgi:hypothetical protein